MKTLDTILGYSTGISLLEISYMLASVLFILGLKKLSHPDTARSGNLWAATGMMLAIIFTILFHKEDGESIGNLGWIFLALALGGTIGWIGARKVKMTAMPQMVSLFNGMGGAAAAVISLIEFPRLQAAAIASGATHMFSGLALTVYLGVMIGGISFSGSMIAFGKLDEKIRDIKTSLIRLLNLVMLIFLLAMAAGLMLLPPGSSYHWLIYVLAGIALIYGVSFVMPIGGADMPVVISLLNSFTGVAAACGGFLYNNQAMITGGILVGSSGMILTILMTRAMNRSLMNVILGNFGQARAAGKGVETRVAREISLTDAAVLLNYSQKVYIVPGYGLAVAQAQHVCHELEQLLAGRGVEVKYAIHPVAGRMPGHMNVLLAEADVPYDKLIEMEDANEEMPGTDVVMVIGANDVVNPAALDEPGSPVYGMPIIKALDAKYVIVIKRSMAMGYAAIDNKLFYHPKNSMLFGDAKQVLQKLILELKEL